MNKEFAKEFIEWYNDRSQFPSAVNEVVLARLYNKAIKLTINLERDGDSYRRVIKKYHLKTGKILEKSQKKCKILRKRISKFL